MEKGQSGTDFVRDPLAIQSLTEGESTNNHSPDVFISY